MKSSVTWFAVLTAAFSNPVLAAPKAKPAAPQAAAPAQPGPQDWRTPDPQNLLVIDTNKGRIVVEMTPEVAPLHVARLRELALAHFYDGQTFFRVIEGFMDQTGDPLNNGTGASTKPDLTAEFFFRRGPTTPMVVTSESAVAEAGFIAGQPVASQSSMLMPLTADGKVSAYGLYCQGVAGMARGGEPDSANSQFFLMRDHYPKLEQRYTAWGRVVEGLDVVRAIKVGEPVAEPQDKMVRLRLASDLPEAERPRLRIVDTGGPWFKAEIARRHAQDGPDLSPCSIEIPVEMK